MEDKVKILEEQIQALRDLIVIKDQIISELQAQRIQKMLEPVQPLNPIWPIQPIQPFQPINPWPQYPQPYIGDIPWQPIIVTSYGKTRI